MLLCTCLTFCLRPILCLKPNHCCHTQDEMKALQRLNTVYFLTGYLGFLTTWILSLIATILGRPALGTAADRTKAVLRVLSPHYCFAQGLYDISNTAPGSGGSQQGAVGLLPLLYTVC